MAASLFSEFDFCSKDSWKIQAENELGKNTWKLKNFRMALHLTVDAYYTASDLDPERTAGLQNCQKKIPGWLNTPLLTVDDLLAARPKINAAAGAGAQAVFLRVNSQDSEIAGWPEPLSDTKFPDMPVFFQTEKSDEKIVEEIRRLTGSCPKGGIANDPLANWMRSGSDFSVPVRNICPILKRAETLPDFRPLMIESHVYHNAGADPVQELAFLISSAVYYLDYFTDQGILPAAIFNHFFYSVSIGPEYLTEIAKLRALRYLHQKIGQAYQVAPPFCNAFVHAQTSAFYQAKYALPTNMIRSASEAMSAVIGGCDALTVLSYTYPSEETSEFGERIARNISSLLAEEGYLARVADPAAGSYQLETMSLRLADAAWELFLETEARGGIISCFETGFIQDEIDKAWTKKRDALRQGKVMVGVNKYSTEETVQASARTDTSEITDTAAAKWLLAKNLSEYW